ncbi:PREDICTED: tryptophan aminotransferase-related protein 2-like [Fragaria vesca subsp. vesca]|uniref:tryptophan aminotransferase-related protein 2-like n=1 Tax=Fragaria vesca subsp. vesca TaxID=101020 RepID=UPI0002C3274B|nr:PREDICTED: tryptophan aminotransferase-related protein 2-like [Fragaria vesca subsp. vesca]
MANFFSIFTITNLLILSLALNLSLVMRVYLNSEKHGQPKVVDVEGPATQRTLLSVSSSSGEEDIDKVINLNHGDPTMYEKYWMMMGDKTTVVIPGWHSMSYFSDVKNLCWFLEPQLAMQIIKLHKAVGNAVTEGRHIVIGTGSSQLIIAALFALSPADGSEPMSVVSTAPFYSSYPVMSTYLKSGLFNWAGDARSFNKEGPYIEFITSPNNPDGFFRSSTVNRTGGMLVHDLAYYWPQYTPISLPADHDLSLFTFSKANGHAGTRIGWALVKDEEVAKRMIKFIELNTIGVSRDSQLRAAKILEVMTNTSVDSSGESFFDISHHLMAERWRLLRAAVNNSRRFSLPEFAPGFCHFFQKETMPQPAFAWLKCEDDEVEDCESFLRGQKILTRGGSKFGVSAKYVRISMVDKDINFSLFLKRLSKLQ